MEVGSIKIESDFSDYYDNLSNDKSSIVYKRYYKYALDKVEGLRYLKGLGINTIDIAQVSSISEFSGVQEVIVYTNSNNYEKNERVMSLSEAKFLYPNYLASPFYREDMRNILKVIQIGSIRMTLNIDTTAKYEIGKTVKVERLTDSYNYVFMRPIFSIDYMANNNGFTAIRFNDVQCLSAIGINQIIKASDVVDEIKNAMLAYNKC